LIIRKLLGYYILFDEQLPCYLVKVNLVNINTTRKLSGHLILGSWRSLYIQ
jgi:hypothetical protein